MWYRRAIV